MKKYFKCLSEVLMLKTLQFQVYQTLQYPSQAEFMGIQIGFLVTKHRASCIKLKFRKSYLILLRTYLLMAK